MLDANPIAELILIVYDPLKQRDDTDELTLELDTVPDPLLRDDRDVCSQEISARESLPRMLTPAIEVLEVLLNETEQHLRIFRDNLL